MLIIGLVLAWVGALLHVFIFYLESISWTGPRARATFGTSADQAEQTRELAYNQGFYNLFLAVEVVIGTALVAAGYRSVGVAVVLVGVGSMIAAAVLFATSPDKRRAALVQGTAPALAAITIAIGLAAG